MGKRLVIDIVSGVVSSICESHMRNKAMEVDELTMNEFYQSYFLLNFI
jgi:hypothetical protein